MSEERRTLRSEEIHEALGLQLAACARRAALSSIILAEDQGLPVASTGDPSEAEEVAALAPLLLNGGASWHGSVQTEDGIKPVTICPVSTEIGRLFLCAVGGSGKRVDMELMRGGLGVCRILN
jgi:hypothetical protein